MTCHLAVMLVAEVHIGIAAVAVVVIQPFGPVLDTAVLPVVILALRRPCGDFVGQIIRHIVLKLLPVAVFRTVSVNVDAVDAHRLILQALQLARALNRRHDSDN